MPVNKNNPNRRHNSFKVAIDGVEDTNSNDDDIEDEVEELIEEDIPDTDRDDNTAQKQLMGDGLQNSGGNYGITVSQSLGIDPSVDSLALDEYDHIETLV